MQWRLKVILIISVGFANLASAEAARASSGRKWFGVNFYGGFSSPTFNHVGGNPFIGYTGLAVGTGIEIKALPEIALAIDFLYTEKGYTVVENGGLSRYGLSFLEFPMKIKVYPSQYLAFFAGPYLSGLVISALKESSGTAGGTKMTYKNDFGLTAGLWFGIPTHSILTLGIDLRYDYGLADVANTFNPADRIYTRAFLGTFVFGLSF